jgi:hypothetical protein
MKMPIWVWVAMPVLCALGLVLMGIATALPVAYRNSDPTVNALGPFIAIYILFGALALIAAAGVGLWLLTR